MAILECPLCGGITAGRTGLCRQCEADLPRPLRPCKRCSVELPDSGPWRDYCDRCLLEPPGFDRCLGAFRYEFPVRELIASFKFQADFATGRTLAQVLAQKLAEEWTRQPETPVLIPVPLHVSRLRERGFNQSALIAGFIARHCGLALDLHNCRRVRATSTQRGLRATERDSNLRQAFALVEPNRIPAHVVIVDDVVTTMATVDALARLYRQSGARRIDVVCLARVS